ncbi:cytokine receptor common subunit gamma isoform X2 [Alligator sinensis]|uniref:Cytokine receptor common subunit gamma isoform X2 n=1 Tax=Alligator sinensis TaxID=38654 RepID=A0A1U7S2J5_ALLSI|nr:cytokine receptor common subunit gamma isoform X2 [Alligator sinensis]
MRARAAQEGAGMILAVLLLCGLGQLGTAAPGSQGVKCVVFNDEYMTCMWGDQEDQPAANYSLYYWYQHQPAVTECRRYLRHNGINTGCWFSHSEITLFQTFRVHVNASHGSRIQVIPTYDMKLQDLVKPDPPVNLTLQNMSNHQLQLSWHTPYPRQQCVEHAVRYKSNKDTDWTVHGVSGQLFSFPSVDEEKKYTFQVRSKINQYCGSTQLWSEWSVPMYWGNTMAHKCGSSSCRRCPTPARPSTSSSTPTRATSRNGPVSPRTWWRASHPTTARASATSVSCSPRRARSLLLTAGPP